MSEAFCVAAAGQILTILAGSFSLEWTHSVEKTAWWEFWRVADGALVLTEARVQGAGAGMEAPPGAVLKDDGWHYRPDLPPIPKLVLGTSGDTGSGWTLCASGKCREIGLESGPPIEIWAAVDDACGLRPDQAPSFSRGR